MSREIGFAPRCAELRPFAAKNPQTVENDRECLGSASVGGCSPTCLPPRARVRVERVRCAPHRNVSSLEDDLAEIGRTVKNLERNRR